MKRDVKTTEFEIKIEKNKILDTILIIDNFLVILSLL